jgi:hypothetical protein
MALDVRRAKEALRASGMSSSSLSGLRWPFGREKRLLSLLRERRAVLEAKNHIVDYLFSAQRAVGPLALASVEGVQAALQDSEKRRVIVTVGANRAMLQEELSARYGSELGRALDQALMELEGEGVLLQVPGRMVSAHQNVFLAVFGRGRPQYEISELTRLLQQGQNQGARLRQRARKEDASGGSRTYRM